MGACLATADAAKGLTAGAHGTTFGGNPLAMAVGNAVLDVVLEPGFIERVAQLGLLVAPAARRAARTATPSVIEEIRGEGLMVGVKVRVPPPTSPRGARGETARPFPPATTSCGCCRRSSSTEEELAEGVRRLDAACAEVATRRCARAPPDDRRQRRARRSAISSIC